MKLRLLIAIMLLGTSSMTYAADSYWGVDYMLGTVKTDSSGGREADPTAIRGRYGRYLKPHVAAEAHVALGLSGDNLRRNSELEIDQFLGIYILGELDVAESVNLYGRGGFTFAEATVSSSTGSESDDAFDLAFGGGIDIKIAKNKLLNIDWMNYVDGDVESSALSIGIKFKL